MAAALALPAACREAGDPDRDLDADEDTLGISIPEDTEERVEEAARRVGGAVGEAMEVTGEAIERAGERVQDETIGEAPADAEPDTLVP